MANLQTTDEQKGLGQQNNTLLELQRAAKAAKRPSSAAGVEKPKRPTSAAAVEKPAEPSADAGAPKVSLASRRTEARTGQKQDTSAGWCSAPADTCIASTNVWLAEQCDEMLLPTAMSVLLLTACRLSV